MKINYRKLFVYIFIVFAFAIIPSLFVNNSDFYNELLKPSFSPPGYIFGIVWPILYLLMAIGIFFVNEGNSKNTAAINFIFFLQLFVNSLWTVLFFGFNLQFLSFLWIILLIILVILMIKEFYKINKASAFLQIPYLLWLIFAAFLNFSIFLLNKY